MVFRSKLKFVWVNLFCWEIHSSFTFQPTSYSEQQYCLGYIIRTRDIELNAPINYCEIELEFDANELKFEVFYTLTA